MASAIAIFFIGVFLGRVLFISLPWSTGMQSQKKCKVDLQFDRLLQLGETIIPSNKEDCCNQIHGFPLRIRSIAIWSKTKNCRNITFIKCTINCCQLKQHKSYNLLSLLAIFCLNISISYITLFQNFSFYELWARARIKSKLYN